MKCRAFVGCIYAPFFLVHGAHPTKTSKDYESEYCFVFEIEAGKIRRVREYADTQKLIDLMS